MFAPLSSVRLAVFAPFFSIFEWTTGRPSRAVFLLRRTELSELTDLTEKLKQAPSSAIPAQTSRPYTIQPCLQSIDSINHPRAREDPVASPYNNDYHLTDDEQTLSGELTDSTIVQFLKRTTVHIDELVSFDFKPVSQVSHGLGEWKLISMPRPLAHMERVNLSVETNINVDPRFWNAASALYRFHFSLQCP